uniref:Uncharacterized protein n=1 Tax=Meloidogyne enterolobii TaxID=390850 RepID=A0A6V7XNW7_MELEN|nr:unnamed protein product [Meloidogyne enterolobii]
MKFSIYNFNGSKKKQIMFVNIVALLIAVLVLFGQVDTTGAKNVGLGNHILKEGKVNLAAGSTIVATNKDIEQYKAKFPDACDVDFDNEGNIVLHYKSQGATKEKGCTVDLLTDMKNTIVFTTGLSHSAGLENCLTDLNSNTLPFAYSLLNEEISQFHNGPIFGNGGGCCAGTCVKRTGLEVSWELQEKRKISILVLNVNPIGVALIRYTGQELSIVEEKREYPTVMITYQFPRYRISFPNKGNVSAKNSCVKNIHQNILPPNTWEIASTSPDPRMKRLLVFHLFPQSASRNREWLQEENRYKIRGNPLQGPDCDDLNIKFSKRNYKLINVLSTPETTKPPTNDKSQPPSTSNEPSSTSNNPPSTNNDPPSTSNNPTNNNQISSTLANNENNSTTSTPEDNLVTTTGQVTRTDEVKTSTASKGSSVTTAASTITTTTKSTSSIGVIIVVIGVILIIVIGVSVYFFVIRKKPDKKGKDAEGGDEAKGDAEEEDDKKEEKEDEGDKSKDKEEDDKSKEDDEEDDKKEVKGSESKTEGETKEEEQTGATSGDTEAKEEGQTNEVESLSPEEKRIEDEIYK